MKEKIPTETLLALHEQGLSHQKIAEKVGMSKAGVGKRLRNHERHGGEPPIGRPKKKKPDWPYINNQPLKNRGPLAEIKTYKMSAKEIERRYGKPGALAEPVGTAVTYGWPGGGEENERHYARRDE